MGSSKGCSGGCKDLASAKLGSASARLSTQVCSISNSRTLGLQQSVTAKGSEKDTRDHPCGWSFLVEIKEGDSYRESIE